MLKEVRMGLDMYLYGKRFLWSNDEGKKIKERVSKLFSKFSFPHKARTIKFEIMYWRKANAIHKWFVDNVQDGNDDCKTYFVSDKQLRELRDTLKKFLTDKTKVVLRLNKDALSGKDTGLPTQDGFFFGGTEYDRYYWDELERTLKMLEKIFNNPKDYVDIDFEYHSSW